MVSADSRRGQAHRDDQVLRIAKGASAVGVGPHDCEDFLEFCPNSIRGDEVNPVAW
jgi:hypothetical protein